MRRLRRAALDALLIASLGIVTVPWASTVAAFSSATSSPANRFTNLVVSAATLAPASPSGGNVHLSWSASATAATETVTYLVLRRPSGGAFSVIASTAALAYDDAPGDGTWEYAVRASVSTFAADSNSTSVFIDLTPPTSASGVTAASGTANGTVSLGWTAGTDAGSGVAGYAIRYVQATTCPAANPASYPGTTAVGVVTSAVVSGLTRNKAYCFYLITTDAAGNQSGPSNVASAKAK